MVLVVVLVLPALPLIRRAGEFEELLHDAETKTRVKTATQRTSLAFRVRITDLTDITKTTLYSPAWHSSSAD